MIMASHRTRFGRLLLRARTPQIPFFGPLSAVTALAFKESAGLRDRRRQRTQPGGGAALNSAGAVLERSSGGGGGMRKSGFLLGAYFPSLPRCSRASSPSPSYATFAKLQDPQRRRMAVMHDGHCSLVSLVQPLHLTTWGFH